MLEINNKNIGEFIDEFVENNGLDDVAKDVIYQYFYEIFEKNIEDFSNIIGNKKQIEIFMDNKFSPEQTKLIQQFIEWENKDKDDAIVALMGCSLEYSMLINNSLFGTRLGSIFSNKVLYIDTNIIYYCLGINGNDYKMANENLLDKCLKAKEQIKITSYTEKEFYNTLNHYIDVIKKYESPSIPRMKYWNYMKNEDVYLFYLKWKNTRNRFNDANYFKKYIEGEYRKWLKKYNVIIDSKKPFDENNEKDKQKLQEYCSEIPYKGTENYDACNLFWIEKLRGKEENRSFSEEKYYFLSPHRALKKWDSSSEERRPIVVAPEIWMTMLNRFVSRSKDDYKSYINFINIKVPDEEAITNKQFLIVTKAIEEVTAVLEQQENIIDVLVEEKYAYLKCEEELSEEETYEKTLVKAESILSSRVTELEDRVNEMEKVVQDSKNREASNEKQNKEEKEKIEKATIQKSSEIYARDKLKNRRIINGFIIGGLTAVWGVILLDFFVFKNGNNIIWCLLERILKDTKVQYNIGDIFMELIIFVSTTIFGYFDYNMIKIFYDKKTIDKYIENYKNSYQKKYNKYK